MSYRTAALVVSLAVVATACHEASTAPHVISANTSIAADRSTGDTPNYNLEVILRPPCNADLEHCPIAGDGFGHVKFRQSGNDNVQRIDLGVWVRGLTPDTEYFLQRAVDTNLNGVCSSTSWLPLGVGKALPAQSITPARKGPGSEALFRTPANPPAAPCDIPFRIAQASGPLDRRPDPTN